MNQIFVMKNVPIEVVCAEVAAALEAKKGRLSARVLGIETVRPLIERAYAGENVCLRWHWIVSYIRRQRGVVVSIVADGERLGIVVTLGGGKTHGVQGWIPIDSGAGRGCDDATYARLYFLEDAQRDILLGKMERQSSVISHAFKRRFRKASPASDYHNLTEADDAAYLKLDRMGGKESRIVRFCFRNCKLRITGYAYLPTDALDRKFTDSAEEAGISEEELALLLLTM